MTDISDINWHDSVIIKIIEIPTDSRLIFEVNYPIDWELHKGIVGTGHSRDGH
jgi:hypothetical protein